MRRAVDDVVPVVGMKRPAEGQIREALDANEGIQARGGETW